jgi:hypothetical protein
MGIRDMMGCGMGSTASCLQLAASVDGSHLEQVAVPGPDVRLGKVQPVACQLAAGFGPCWAAATIADRRYKRGK